MQHKCSVNACQFGRARHLENTQLRLDKLATRQPLRKVEWRTRCLVSFAIHGICISISSQMSRRRVERAELQLCNCQSWMSAVSYSEKEYCGWTTIHRCDFGKQLLSDVLKFLGKSRQKGWLNHRENEPKQSLTFIH